MPIDWNAVDHELDTAIENAEQRTDERLASRISSLTRLTDAEILEMFPTPTDVEKLTQLLKIVKSAQERNEKVAAIARNIHDLGGTVVKLLEKFA